MRELTVTVFPTGGRIRLAGRLDRKTSYHLLDAVRMLNAASHSHWVIETAELRFCDASGLRIVNACYRTALRQGAHLTLPEAPPWPRAALVAMKLDAHVLEEGHANNPSGEGS
ncbi:STAS domain-containing protein [Modestobacter lacusdianchii]